MAMYKPPRIDDNKNMNETTTYTVRIDHGYEGEKYRYTTSLEKAMEIWREAELAGYLLHPTEIRDSEDRLISGMTGLVIDED